MGGGGGGTCGAWPLRYASSLAAASQGMSTSHHPPPSNPVPPLQPAARAPQIALYAPPSADPTRVVPMAWATIAASSPEYVKTGRGSVTCEGCVGQG